MAAGVNLGEGQRRTPKKAFARFFAAAIAAAPWGAILAHDKSERALGTSFVHRRSKSRSRLCEAISARQLE
jgi:hypothetical protein